MIGRLNVMKLMRQNTRLAWVLATLFVAQFFVPLALASLRSDAENIGIVICTSSGLKTFASNSEPVSNKKNDEQNVGQKDCLICLINGLGSSADLPPLSAVEFLSPSTGVLTRFYDKFGFVSDTNAKSFEARAPPVRV